MSFATDILSLMTGDSSINAEVEDRIFYENLPDNFDLNLEWILYHYRRAGQSSCLNGANAFRTFEVTVIIITQDTERLEDLTEMVISHLDGNGAGDIMDVVFTGDGHSFDQEKNIYMNTLNFDAFAG